MEYWWYFVETRSICPGCNSLRFGELISGFWFSFVCAIQPTSDNKTSCLCFTLTCEFFWLMRHCVIDILVVCIIFVLGLVGLMNKNMVSGLISKYAQVVLWFCRTGLLPEGSGKVMLSWINWEFIRIESFKIDQFGNILWYYEEKFVITKMTSGSLNKQGVGHWNLQSIVQVSSFFFLSSLLTLLDDDALQISRPFYTHSVISNYYTIRREELTRLAKWVAKAIQVQVD